MKDHPDQADGRGGDDESSDDDGHPCNGFHDEFSFSVQEFSDRAGVPNGAVGNLGNGLISSGKELWCGVDLVYEGETAGKNVIGCSTDALQRCKHAIE